jgi:hypothetical protein
MYTSYDQLTLTSYLLCVWITLVLFLGVIGLGRGVELKITRISHFVFIFGIRFSFFGKCNCDGVRISTTVGWAYVVFASMRSSRDLSIALRTNIRM